jgi:hypothetical protein
MAQQFFPLLVHPVVVTVKLCRQEQLAPVQLLVPRGRACPQGVSLLGQGEQGLPGH